MVGFFNPKVYFSRCQVTVTWLCCVPGLCCHGKEWVGTLHHLLSQCPVSFPPFTCSSTTSSLAFFYFYGLWAQLLWFYVKFYIVWVFSYISQGVAVPLETFLEECFVDLWTHQYRLCLQLKKSLLLNPKSLPILSSPTLGGGGSGSYCRFLNLSS